MDDNDDDDENTVKTILKEERKFLIRILCRLHNFFRRWKRRERIY